MFSTTIKTWGVLGGKVLHFAYFEHIPQYMDIACAISNAFRGCLDAKQGVNDEQDFNTMKRRISHQNEIQKLLKKSETNKRTLKSGKFVRFKPEDEQKLGMTEAEIRTYACGPYAMKLATPYVTFWSELEANIKFWYHKTPQGLLLKCSGLKSRFSPRIAREVFLLYKGVPLKLLDTLCSCHGGLRPIGGCAHAIAVLRLLSQLTNRVEPVQPTRSELMLKRALWYFQGSDSEGSTGSGSGSDSDTESSSSSAAE